MNWFGETLVQLDFEFNRPMERNMGLVAMSWNYGSDLDTAQAMRLTTPTDWAEARSIIGDTMQGKVLVAHNAVAEASCFVALGLNPRDFTWADTMLEYRQLQNSNNEWSYGKYYKDMGAFGYKLCESRSMFKRSDLSEWDTMFGLDRELAISKASSRIANAGYTQEKVSVGLVNARLNLLGMQGDPGFKSATRDKIIAGGDWTEEDWAEILAYAKSDVVALDKLLLRLTEEIQKRCKFDDDRMKQAILWRGRSACNHAIMERQGTPINVERWRNLVHNKPLIIRQEQEKFQKEVWPIFEWDRKENRYKTRPSRELATPWVEQMERELGITWPKSDNGNWSWATDPGYPMDQYNKIHAGITALNKLNGIINGLKAHTTDAEAVARKAGGKKVFADYLGSDGYVRPYLNAYGSQTSRTQPSAISYIYLQASWMRALIEPPKGWVIAECLAQGTMVLTKSRGFTTIETITQQDEVWDGEDWVKHCGVVCRGTRDVVEKQGVWATGDHRFLGKDGEWLHHAGHGTYERYDIPRENKTWRMLWRLVCTIGLVGIKRGWEAVSSRWEQTRR